MPYHTERNTAYAIEGIDSVLAKHGHGKIPLLNAVGILAIIPKCIHGNLANADSQEPFEIFHRSAVGNSH
jgi:hypothetical protein